MFFPQRDPDRLAPPVAHVKVVIMMMMMMIIIIMMIYIYYDKVFVCLSRIMSNSSWESPVTTCYHP